MEAETLPTSFSSMIPRFDGSDLKKPTPEIVRQHQVLQFEVLSIFLLKLERVKYAFV